MITIRWCQHPRPGLQPVTSQAGEEVGRLCSACQAALPLSWGCPFCSWEAVFVIDRVEPIAMALVWPCEAHREGV